MRRRCGAVRRKSLDFAPKGVCLPDASNLVFWLFWRAKYHLNANSFCTLVIDRYSGCTIGSYVK